MNESDMKSPLLISILILFSLNVHAERVWTYFGENDAKDKIFIDPNSIVNMTKYLIFADVFVTYNISIDDVTSEFTLRVFDCRNKLMKLHEAYFFSGTFENLDDMVGFYNDEILVWDLYNNKSIWRDLLDFVCNKKK